MGFKRYVKNAYPIAGIRWTDGNDTNGEFGVLLNKLNITNDNDRRQISDEQVLINLDNLRITLRAEANTASNLGGGSGVFAQKVGEDLQFKSLVGGAGIVLATSGEEITISTGPGGVFLSNFETFQLPASGIKGNMIFDTTINKVRVWNGIEWKILSFE